MRLVLLLVLGSLSACSSATTAPNPTRTSIPGTAASSAATSEASPTASAGHVPPSITSAGPLPDADETGIGGDSDDQGCLASAGMTWSPIRNRCLRLFEQGLSLDPVPLPTGSSAVISAFIVFAGEDRTPANNETLELVILSEPAPLRLTRSNSPSVYSKAGSPFRVKAGKSWTVERDGKVIFEQAR